MPARFAAAFTTCHIALAVILSPQILSSRLILRKIAPPLMPAAVVHSSTAKASRLALSGLAKGAPHLSQQLRLLHPPSARRSSQTERRRGAHSGQDGRRGS